MDSWKYYDIVHRHHTLMNPVNEDRLFEVFDLLRLPEGSRVTDIGCGKGEMLIRLAENYKIKGVGVDKSPYAIREAQRRKGERVARADLKFLEIDGKDYRPEGDASDLSMCIGASWIYDGYKNTLKALSSMTRPLGWVMVGEPFWRKSPPAEYLRRAKLTRRLFGTHHGNVKTCESLGLAPVYALVSSLTDWDKYEGLHWYAAQEYAVLHPEDPDLKEILARDSRDRETYLKYERDTLGWAVYLSQKNAD